MPSLFLKFKINSYLYPNFASLFLGPDYVLILLVWTSLWGYPINSYWPGAPLSGASLVAQLVKNPPAMRETWVQSLGLEDPLEKRMATHSSILGLTCGSAGKESTCSAGDLGSIPGLGRSPGEGNGNPLQYSGLENSMDCVSPWSCKELDTTEPPSLWAPCPHSSTRKAIREPPWLSLLHLLSLFQPS